MKRRGAIVIRDSPPNIPLSRYLNEGDVVLLLTPGVVPNPITATSTGNEPTSSSSDPFEPFGRGLAKHHPWIHHVPYLPRNGITNTHMVHIRLAKTVVFVISGPPSHGQLSQVELAETARAICEHRPQVIVACCNIRDLGLLESAFPTIIQLPDYSTGELEAAADFLFQEPRVQEPRRSLTGPNVQNLILSPKAWPVEVWDGRDLTGIEELWSQCLPKKFHLSGYLFRSLLVRDGYAMHYIVREPGTPEVLGFCATYTTYANGGDDERLIGSVAAVLVRPSYRQRGIGLSLHNHALNQLKKPRGVCRLQLGSTFPRLLYGIPVDSPAEDWFRRRNWPIHPQSGEPGSGQEACDWFLQFEDWPATSFMPSGLTFRPCEFNEFDMVLDIVAKESKRKDNAGWYDQYAKLGGTMDIQDIVLGLEGNRIVATALTYVKRRGSAVADDLPWTATISDDVGGVTCICIADDNPNMANRRDTIMIRLLDSCIRLLSGYGMKSMFIDAIKGGDDGFQSMGFQKWARYREVWRDI
ncbi:hypothetical protein B0T19DRAFT_441641 [Cercophora scortea]|uniref:N-acetyltransferase domain-containing protein n=1 Tax=Cercophora scortea TaxID=314031 RepID=A0AAE0IMC6_9PEZI|nr:hypothetical protein B0T19DRAFT_441641 [Cercophora scortea]